MTTLLSAPVAPGPYYNAFAVNKSDTNFFPAVRALYIGGAGNLVLTFNGGATPVTITGVLAGQIYELSVVQVLNATTATDIVGLY